MTEDPIKLYPPGPFPPQGSEAPGTLDLGIRLRDQLFTARFVTQLARQALLNALDAALAASNWKQAAELVEALVDSWPAAVLVDEARQRWTGRPDGPSLAVLARVSRIAQLALGWPAIPPEGIWPMPGAAWIKKQAGSRPMVLASRGEGDGSQTIAEVLSIAVSAVEQGPEPGLEVMPGEELASKREEVAGRLVRGEIAGVWFTTPVPPDPQSQLALAEIRLESDLQVGLERYGRAGLAVEGPVPLFTDLLTQAPPGRAGDVLEPLCEGLVLPGTPSSLSTGVAQPAGWLVWSRPYLPLAVHPIAAAIVNQLDGRHTAQQLADELEAPLEVVQDILMQLVQVGAVTATARGETG